jgi:hypothetical protein
MLQQKEGKLLLSIAVVRYGSNELRHNDARDFPVLLPPTTCNDHHHHHEFFQLEIK